MGNNIITRVNTLPGTGHAGSKPRAGCSASARVYWSSHGCVGESVGAGAGLRALYDCTTTYIPPESCARARSARDMSCLLAPCPLHAIKALVHFGSSDFAPCRCPYHDQSSCRKCRSTPYLENRRCTGWRAVTLTAASGGSPPCRPWLHQLRRLATNGRRVPMPLLRTDVTGADLKVKEYSYLSFIRTKPCTSNL